MRSAHCRSIRRWTLNGYMALIGSTSLTRSYVRISLRGICVLSVDEVAETWKVPSEAANWLPKLRRVFQCSASPSHFQPSQCRAFAISRTLGCGVFAIRRPSRRAAENAETGNWSNWATRISKMGHSQTHNAIKLNDARWRCGKLDSAIPQYCSGSTKRAKFTMAKSAALVSGEIVPLMEHRLRRNKPRRLISISGPSKSGRRRTCDCCCTMAGGAHARSGPCHPSGAGRGLNASNRRLGPAPFRPAIFPNSRKLTQRPGSTGMREFESSHSSQAFRVSKNFLLW
jgi:hypothetical protein